MMQKTVESAAEALRTNASQTARQRRAELNEQLWRITKDKLNDYERRRAVGEDVSLSAQDMRMIVIGRDAMDKLAKLEEEELLDHESTKTRNEEMPSSRVSEASRPSEVLSPSKGARSDPSELDEFTRAPRQASGTRDGSPACEIQPSVGGTDIPVCAAQPTIFNHHLPLHERASLAIREIIEKRGTTKSPRRALSFRLDDDELMGEVVNQMELLSDDERRMLIRQLEKRMQDLGRPKKKLKRR